MQHMALNLSLEFYLANNCGSKQLSNFSLLALTTTNRIKGLMERTQLKRLPSNLVQRHKQETVFVTNS